jgi:hypothetical protein
MKKNKMDRTKKIRKIHVSKLGVGLPVLTSTGKRYMKRGFLDSDWIVNRKMISANDAKIKLSALSDKKYEIFAAKKML